MHIPLPAPVSNIWSANEGYGVNEMVQAHKRLQSFAEEIANGISHGIALAACLIATPFLINSAFQPYDARRVVGAAIFAGAMIFMYLSSTLYHVLPENRAKRVFRVLDHIAIFLLIAGTYTPFTLGVLRGAWGWTLFGIVWSLAVLGMTLKISGVLWHPLISTGLYLAMGWLIGHSDPTTLVESAIAGHSLAVGGRHRLHGWSGILCG